MSTSLRIILLIAAAVFSFWILHQIRRLKIKLEHAIYWVVFAVLLAVLGIFPEITYWLTRKLGMLSPANLIFLVIIFLLLLKVFTLSMLTSQLEDKITILTAEVALRTLDAEHRLDAQEDKEVTGIHTETYISGRLTSSESLSAGQKQEGIQ